MRLVYNPYFLGFLGVYALAVGVLTFTGVYSLAEPLMVLAIFGVILPATAYGMCHKRSPFPVRVEAGRGEMLTVLGCFLFVIFYLLWGSAWIDGYVYRFLKETPRIAPEHMDGAPRASPGRYNFGHGTTSYPVRGQSWLDDRLPGIRAGRVRSGALVGSGLEL
jgi:hypothetical protein